jgi:branched-chain amino acid transport system ATP-binding protein
MGMLARTDGGLSFEGRSLRGLEPFEIARMGIGYVPEDRRIFTDLTVMENLEVGRQPPRAGTPAWSSERLFEVFPNLAQMRERLGGSMSGGEQQMLTVARTLMGNPSLVLLDEPSEGIAPIIVEQMAAMIVELKREGLSVLLSEQNLRFAQRISDRAYVLEKGVVRYAGAMAELARSQELQRTYLSV